ncbi:MAG: hypothetical protein J7L59_00485 [Nanoarchaeota archaeon]|nr:hypothetical protein [Nanoarchaeota archaeon]
MGRSSSSKSQLFSSEAVVVVVFFLSLLSVFNLYVSNRLEEFSLYDEYSRLRERAIRVTDLLLRTAGVPEDWNGSNYLQLGLAEEEYIISSQKLGQLLNLSEEEVAGNLGLDGYRLFLNISSALNYTSWVEYILGEYPSSSQVAIPVRRLALLDVDGKNIPVKVLLVVWR